MKLAFITLMAGQPFGGSEVLWSRMALLALEEGHDVLVSAYDWKSKTHPVYRELEEKGAVLLKRRRYNEAMTIHAKLRTYLEIRNRLRTRDWEFLSTFKPNLVLINQGGCFDLLQHNRSLILAMQKNKIRYTLISHSHPQYSYLPDPSVYPDGKEVFSNAAYTVFISQRQKEIVEKALLCRLSNAIFSWNPLNLENPVALPWPKENTFEMALSGALVSGKGHDLAIEILSTDSWRDRNWNLNIYGSGPGEKYLRDLSGFYDLNERITFHGHVASATEIYNENHILLVPSSAEGLPISMLEALTSGRPVVATDVGGIREILVEGINGFIAEAPSLSSFSDALERAWNQKERWSHMGNIAREIMDKIDLRPEITLLNKILS